MPDYTISINAREQKVIDALTDDPATWIDDLARARLINIIKDGITDSTNLDGRDLSISQIAKVVDAITFKPYDAELISGPYDFRDLVESVDKQVLKEVFDL